jgi:hypothetical protein
LLEVFTSEAMGVLHAHEPRCDGRGRREWQLAVGRTTDMVSGVPLIVSVAVDVAESRTLVPGEFIRVQGTHRLHGGPAPHFVDHGKRLPFVGASPAAGRPADTANASEADELLKTGREPV